ncbi:MULTISPECIES: HAL/PAL/TAL family ammonia-lyase [Micromonospora]|uniref:Histidine ammonia-lyase n=1 Tax=Micromonospora rifamycinica TaxID=291594 RepID=A0A125Q132_9ACTN|nr:MULTISPECIES: aromatic amino acid ammonia-lyase [Micromonospora]KWV30890.1 histidine ammonia-lyase [Micromonospora rifamycinica]WFE65287.1 aromatic amino acid ammonia-lyase [Micromonospora sp. WMMD714]SCG46432.1 histidine ammonia-lyase [Micromonospora rifamycinica]
MTTEVDLAAPLRIADLSAARDPVRVVVGPQVRDRVTHTRVFLSEVLGEDRAVYGSTTGFGALVGYAGRADLRDQADNTLAHLGAGHGPDLAPEIVRATVLVRAWSLAQGASGVSPHVVDALAAMLGTTFVPAVPRWGSVGASGDLIPLGAAAQALRGRGHAYLDGVRLPAAEALARAGLEPLPLDGRDALALVNGTSLTTAATALALSAVRAVHRAQQVLTCLLADLLGADPQFLDARLLRAYGHPGAIDVGAGMRRVSDGLVPSGKRPLQEPYSIRCAPQLLGAAEDALRHVDAVVAADLGSVSDNPLFFPDEDLVVHGGNFFGQPAAFAADLLSMVVAQLGNLAERQLDLLVDPHRNGGLPPMLAAGPGQQHGLQGVQLASTALIAEIRRDAMPASMQSLPTNLHNQDVIPLGTQAALRVFDQAGLLRLIVGSLALGLRQAAHVGARTPTAPGCGEALAALAAAIPPVDPDRPLDSDVRRAADVVDELGLPLTSLTLDGRRDA